MGVTEPPPMPPPWGKVKKKKKKKKKRFWPSRWPNHPQRPLEWGQSQSEKEKIMFSPTPMWPKAIPTFFFSFFIFIFFLKKKSLKIKKSMYHL
jgi:hypothetical protein